MADIAPVSSSFCVPHETRLEIKWKRGFSGEQFTIKDDEGIPLFNTTSTGGLFSTTKRRIHDATSGRVLLLIRRVVYSCAPSDWVAFRGDSESENELVFTMRKISTWSSTYAVFLSENSDASSPNFSLEKKSWWGTSFGILQNGRPLAEVKKNAWGPVYIVTVYPQVDRAFISALVLIWMVVAKKKKRRARGARGA